MSYALMALFKLFICKTPCVYVKDISYQERYRTVLPEIQGTVQNGPNVGTIWNCLKTVPDRWKSKKKTRNGSEQFQ